MSDLSQLRANVLERDGGCVWPGCKLDRSWVPNELQLAHLTHRGMGGAPDRNVENNCVILCRHHHDVFDGRTGVVKLRGELAMMLRTAAGLTLCWDCGGSGEVRFVNGGPHGNEAGWMRCPTCHGGDG